LESLPKDGFLERYSLSPAVELSRFPDDEFPVLVVLEDFPSMNDDFSGVWEEAKFLELSSLVSGLNASVTVAAIPYHYKFLPESALGVVRGLHGGIAQNGFNHKEELHETYDRQVELLDEGSGILKSAFGEAPTIFIPPNYDSSQDTVRALAVLGFQAYVSTPGDPADSLPLVRYDQSVSLIRNWAGNEWLSPSDWIIAKRLARSSEDYFMVSLYYFRMANETENITRAVLVPEKGERLMTVGAHVEWSRFRGNVSFSVNESQVVVSGSSNPLASELTLLVSRSVNMSLSSSYDSLRVKNVAVASVKVCVVSCYELAPGHVTVIQAR
jgi:hypothetical protein